MQRAGASMRQRGRRAAFNGWVGTVASRAATIVLLRRAGAAIRHRGLRVGYNAWLAAAGRAAKVSLMRKAIAAVFAAASAPPKRVGGDGDGARGGPLMSARAPR